MNREELLRCAREARRDMANKVQAAYVLGFEELSSVPPPPLVVCCCPNEGRPDSTGLQIQNAGCRIHGIRSTYIERRGERAE